MPSDDVRFRCEWRIAAEPQAVLAVLADVAAYPTWWPGMVVGRSGGAELDWLRIRGRRRGEVQLRLTRMDAPEGVLAARIRGDMLGWCSWHVTAIDGADAAGGAAAGGSVATGSRVVLQQHVILRRRGLRMLAPLARRRIRAEHEHVMRAGEAGLRRLLDA